jgi:hypothetical protein
VSPAQARAAAVADLAAACLDYLAENPEHLAAFMAESGYSAKRLQAAVGSPALQHGLVDFFAQSEPLLLAFCANAGMKPQDFMAVWHRLNPGA